jgi:hypothetical protein
LTGTTSIFTLGRSCVRLNARDVSNDVAIPHPGVSEGRQGAELARNPWAAASERDGDGSSILGRLIPIDHFGDPGRNFRVKPHPISRPPAFSECK